MQLRYVAILVSLFGWCLWLGITFDDLSAQEKKDKPTLSTVVSEVKTSNAAVVAEVKKAGEGQAVVAATNTELKKSVTATNTELKKFTTKQASASQTANINAEAIRRAVADALEQARKADAAARIAAQTASDQAEKMLKLSLAVQRAENDHELAIYTLLGTSFTSIVLAILGRSKSKTEHETTQKDIRGVNGNIADVHLKIDGQLDAFKKEAKEAADAAAHAAYFKGLREAGGAAHAEIAVAYRQGVAHGAADKPADPDADGPVSA